MDALFIGHAYIDVSMLADALPHGDEKTVAKDYAGFVPAAIRRRRPSPAPSSATLRIC